MPVTVVLCDLGGTLADERWMLRSSERFPEWGSVYPAVAERLGPAWGRGEVSAQEVAAEVGVGLGAPAGEVLEHMRWLCRRVDPHPAIMGAVRARRGRGGRQALVTVNPDLFSEIVVPALGLADRFGVIVTSWAEGTDDKGHLCRIALDRLGWRGSWSEVVLVDNLEEPVTAFEAAGGQGYRFTSDDWFEQQVGRGQVPGFLPSDVGQGGGQAPAKPWSGRG